MASSYTTRKRLNKQSTGSNANTWGDGVNTGALDVIDFAMDGWTTLAVSGDHTLSTANGTTSGNEAGARLLKLTTATATYIQTLPALEGWYIVWNATTATQTIACGGGGTTVSILAGEIVFVICDAANVKRMTMLTAGSNRLQNVTDPTSAQDAATKAYVDATAWTYNAGSLPAQTSNAGKYVTTNGTTASWATIFATSAQILAGTATDVGMTPGDTYTALGETVLTSSGGSIALNMAGFVNGFHQMTENTTLANPTNSKVGQSGYILVRQHASAAKTLAVASNWKRVGGALAIGTTLSGYSVIEYQVNSAFITYEILNNPS